MYVLCSKTKVRRRNCGKKPAIDDLGQRKQSHIISQNSMVSLQKIAKDFCADFSTKVLKCILRRKTTAGCKNR